MEIPGAKELEQKVFAITNEKEFETIALDIYQFQFENNPVYQSYCTAISKKPEVVRQLTDIPFLPISFFKTHKVVTTSFDPRLVFKSSGTTATVPSNHYLRDVELYIQSFSKCFEAFYGNIKEYCIIGLLPSYLERGNSSLIFMVDYLIKQSGHEESGFYLYDFKKLDQVLKKIEASDQRAILFGVTYALLDFGQQYPQRLSKTMVMETGGMKGRRKEMTKSELYEYLRSSFGVDHIYSEYGMTELLSQAYGIDGLYQSPPWMKILLRDETDPFYVYDFPGDQSGAINIIDLANVYSCSFIASEDIGKTSSQGGFEVLGRMDHSDIRGCSLLTI